MDVKVKLAFYLILLFGSIACETTSQKIENCGDGVIDIGEECDSLNFGGSSCESLGYYGGEIACSDSCKFILSDCDSMGKCGDSSLQPAYEDCDGDSFGEKTCSSEGFSGGDLLCNSDCTVDTSNCSVCGDGIISSGESCEGDNLNNKTCDSLGYYGGVLTCSEDDCSYNITNCESFGRCGDASIQTMYGEECEGTDFSGATTCFDIDSQYYPDANSLTCDASCHLDLSLCRMCGDNIIDSDMNEQCDNANLDGKSCQSIGFSRGTIHCNQNCQFDGCSMIYTTINSGTHLNCTIDNNGNSWCWGTNFAGQLGNGTTVDSFIPTAVTMPATVQFSSISSGNYYSCAIDTTGKAWCWGTNSFGILGDGTVTNHPNPTPVSITPGVILTKISTGYYHTCAIDTTGQAWCWGRNTYGQLGDGTTEQRLIPTQVSMPQNKTFVDIQASEYRSCAIDQTGSAWCWGDGPLGDGTTDEHHLPTLVSAPAGVSFSSISTNSFHSCAIDTTGQVWCWGGNLNGALGDGTSTDRHLPTQALTTPGITFIEVSAGYHHTCALTSAGNAVCWGENGQGELGDGTNTYSTTPISTSMPTGVSFNTISSWKQKSCGVDTDGNSWCWGTYVGDGTSVRSLIPKLSSQPDLY